ncbi:GHKL domain-containing protein [Lactobacillus reuteri]|uniref:GHKL domain-containing protein n=1 Tax=Limosilactobacillus reuteri TaxID=1598 RepID=A0A7X2KJM5_LIMRT|nr:GHKL domain-containing protein [Limosilactobacillus reuteri]MRH72799.1 GHKL domain-containing protein [Limosilactobacillus reuteri]MRH80901.1 GHKL domain-containing protein [Limosilactobacillus reuteri]
MQFFNIPALLPQFFPSPLYWLSSGLIWNLLYGSAYLLLFSRLSNIHFKWWYFIIAGFIYSFAISLVGNILVILIMLLIIYYFVVHRQISFNIIGNQFIYANFILLITFGCFGSLITFLYNLLVKVPNYNFVYYVLGNLKIIVSFCVAYGIIIWTKKLFNSYINNVVIPYPVLAWIISILMLTFLLYEFRVNGGGHPNKLSITIAVTLSYGIIALIVIKGFTNYYRQKALATTLKFEVDNLQYYTSHIEEMYDELRRFRHDYKNVLYSLTGSLENNDITEAKNILNRVLVPSEDSITQKTSVLSQLENVQNLDLKSLIYNKAMTALKDNLKLTIEIDEPIKFSNVIEPLDLIRILSNLLDNAIKAAKQSKDRQISISLFIKDNNQWIIVGNSTKTKSLNLQQLSNNHNNLESAHGLGLKNLRMILARYPQVQHELSSKNYWLQQVIVIPSK